MSAPTITPFIGGLVVTGLGVLIVLRSVNYNAQSRVS
jgi:hypothetical protein